MTLSKGRRILVVRNDKLGDFMLAWPALACLKRAHPGNRISVLVPAYTAPLAECCPWIDEVILDPGAEGTKAAQRALLERLRTGRFDALLTLFSTPRVGWLGWRARIPLRLAPATKWAQVFYNRRVVQRRSRSARPEYRYNLELAESLLAAMHQSPPRLEPPYWPLAAETRRQERRGLAEELNLDPACRWAFVHPGSGGSAVNLSLDQYADLVTAIAESSNLESKWVLTFGPQERDAAQHLADRLHARDIPAVLLPPRAGLTAFARSLAAADLLIAGSTGPLHVAGCLDVPTAGFYPAKRSATPLRWQTCNRETHRLAFSPPPGRDSETDMTRIDIPAAAARIAEWWPTLPVAGDATSSPGAV
ncbi:glycosyltransferase family 9 protein [Modicisalibacter coralii]|uniref:glycosyltransferase family 9 protein n=1 Tax=Modicisalibacter coralii TaxID=2304602 RepID=UPI00100A3BC5|nr:glycosyltransferase family 9 protein [Halomonas coralii]